MPKLDTIAESLPKYPLVLVLGHTGHGKSTFIKSLLGPEEGKKIKIDGDYHSCEYSYPSFPTVLTRPRYAELRSLGGQTGGGDGVYG